MNTPAFTTETQKKAIASAPPALDLAGVTFHYGKKVALDNVSLCIEQGESVIMLGPNGAGKTTLFSLICGLFAPDQGHIHINGKSRLNDARALAPLGIVFQSQTLDLDLTVYQNLSYFCSLHGINRSESKSRIEAALSRMDLTQRKHEKVRALNGGHRRRVEIVRATLHQPSILLLDEPTVGLDIPTRTELIEQIHQLPKTQGCAILWATHLVDEIHDSDRVMILHESKLVRDGNARQLLKESSVDNFSELLQQVMNP